MANRLEDRHVLGFRDAWSAGLVGPYVLAIRIGDFEAQANPSFVGVAAAASL